MQSKQRLLAAITGQPVDRLPWSPFLAYYWDYQPADVKEQGQLAWLQALGADPLIRGSHVLYDMKYKNCQISDQINGNRRLIRFETPVGTLQETHVYSPNGNTWFLVEHPVRTAEDFKILNYLNENRQIEANLAEFEADYCKLGNDGLYVPIIGSEMKTGFQSLVEHWVGTEELAYALADFPDIVEETLQIMRRNSQRTVEICIQSSAEAFIFWEDSSTTNISPAMFEQYTAPEINQWGRLIHGAGKYLIHHACGHLNALIPLMAKTEIDCIESISPPPTGNIELWDAKSLLADRGTVSLIGGIEPTVFLNSTLTELEAYVINLIDKMGRHNFVLANSDSCPPGVADEKFQLVSELVRKM